MSVCTQKRIEPTTASQYEVSGFLGFRVSSAIVSASEANPTMKSTALTANQVDVLWLARTLKVSGIQKADGSRMSAYMIINTQKLRFPAT